MLCSPAGSLMCITLLYELCKAITQDQARPDTMFRLTNLLQHNDCALQGKRIKDVVNRMHVAVPQARDRVSRPPVIPAGVTQARAARDAGYKPLTEKDLQVRLHSSRLDSCALTDLFSNSCSVRIEYAARCEVQSPVLMYFSPVFAAVFVGRVWHVAQAFLSVYSAA